MAQYNIASSSEAVSRLQSRGQSLKDALALRNTNDSSLRLFNSLKHEDKREVLEKVATRIGKQSQIWQYVSANPTKYSNVAGGLGIDIPALAPNTSATASTANLLRYA